MWCTNWRTSSPRGITMAYQEWRASFKKPDRGERPPLVLFRARSRGCPLNNLLFMTLAFRNILNSEAKNLVGAYRRSPTWYMRAIRVRVSSTLSGFTPIKLISNRDVVTWYTRYTYSQPCLWRNVNFMQKLQIYPMWYMTIFCRNAKKHMIFLNS